MISSFSFHRIGFTIFHTAAALAKAHKLSCQLTQTLTEQLKNQMFTPLMSLMLISAFSTRIFTISTHFLVVATCNAVLWRRKRNYVRQKSTYLQCTLEVQVSEQKILFDFAVSWYQYPTCIMTSCTRAGVKLLQVAIENIWGIPNVCSENPPVCYAERPIDSVS